MGEKDFQQEVIERLTVIETNARYFARGLEIIENHSERISRGEESLKSAHKRIDGICAAAGVAGGIVGGIVQIIAKLLPTKNL